MTTTAPAPTIRVREAQKRPQKKAPKSAPPQQSAETQRLYRRIAQLESRMNEEMALQRELIEAMPQHAVREGVLELTLDPLKYDRGILPAEFYSRVRINVRYYAPYNPPEYEYEEQPALVQLSWRAGGEIYGLNPTEIALLRKNLFRVHKGDGERGYNKQSRYQVLFLEKELTHLWVTLRQDDVKGLSWCCCMTDHIRNVRNQDKVEWFGLMPATETYLSMAPEETNDVQSMLRESQTLFMMDERIRDTLPWEVRTHEETQAALAKLRIEAARMLNGEYKDTVIADRAQVDPTATEELVVVEKRF